jgi:hypothetical protein
MSSIFQHPPANFTKMHEDEAFSATQNAH